MPITIKIDGIQQGMKNLQALAQEAPKEFAAALYQEGELLMTDSKKEIPVDTGAARDSGFVEEPIIKGSDISVTVGYGGVAAKINPKTGESTSTYLEPLHERMGLHHPVGKPKFLEDPAKARAPKIESNITKIITVSHIRRWRAISFPVKVHVGSGRGRIVVFCFENHITIQCSV